MTEYYFIIALPILVVAAFRLFRHRHDFVDKGISKVSTKCLEYHWYECYCGKRKRELVSTFHDWGKWQPRAVNGAGAILQIRSCNMCGTSQTMMS